MLNEEQYKLFDALSAQNFQINPVYVKITGRINYGYLLTQLIFLSRSYNYKSFYKTDAQMNKLYGFTEWELREGREKLKDLGIITTDKKGDGKLYYTIHIEKLIELALLTTQNHSEETTEPIPRKPRNTIPRKPRNLYKENNDLKEERSYKNDLNKQESVDNSISQSVLLKKNFYDLSFDERLLHERLIETKVNPSVAIIAVSNLAIYQILDIFKSAEYKASKGKFEKNEAAYITGGINKLLEQALPPRNQSNSMEGYQDTTFR